jgi:hypothetical protein
MPDVVKAPITTARSSAAFVMMAPVRCSPAATAAVLSPVRSHSDRLPAEAHRPQEHLREEQQPAERDGDRDAGERDRTARGGHGPDQRLPFGVGTARFLAVAGHDEQRVVAPAGRLRSAECGVRRVAVARDQGRRVRVPEEVAREHLRAHGPGGIWHVHYLIEDAEPFFEAELADFGRMIGLAKISHA